VTPDPLPAAQPPIPQEIFSEYLAYVVPDPSECGKRAAFLKEDFNWVNFARLSLSAGPCRHRLGHQIIELPVVEYHFGKTGFSADNAENPFENRAEWFGGTGLSCGSLHLFSKVGLIARARIPQYWLKSVPLAEALRNPTQHLNTVEEIWWLDRFIGVEHVTMAARLVPGLERDIDWRMQFNGGRLALNLEVKRVPSDCIRHVRGRQFGREWFKKFCEEKVLPKYRPSGSGEINVLALSLFGEIDRDVQLIVSDWLTSGQNLLDGILIASRESRRRSGFDRQLLAGKAHLLTQFLNPPDAEDQRMVFRLQHPQDYPELDLPFVKPPRKP